MVTSFKFHTRMSYTCYVHVTYLKISSCNKGVLCKCAAVLEYLKNKRNNAMIYIQGCFIQNCQGNSLC